LYHLHLPGEIVGRLIADPMVKSLFRYLPR
jgi:hypothetical protein